MTEQSRRRVWWGVACACVAVAILAAIPVVFGVPDRLIYVAWRNVGDESRQLLERRFGLSEATRLADGRWAYVPRDLRPDILRELVRHPSVRDTDGIDRNTFTLSAKGPLTGRRRGLIAAPTIVSRTAKGAGYLFAAAACALLLQAIALRKGVTAAATLAATATGLSIARASRRRVASAVARVREAVWQHRPTFATLRAAGLSLQRGVPVVSAEAAGLFRILFGSLVLACVLLEPMAPEHINAYDVGGARGIYGDFLKWLSRKPAVVESLGSWLVMFGGLFIAGVATRVSYAGFLGAFIAWASVRSLARTHHVVSALTVAMICLLAARWGEAWSVDAWVRRKWTGRTPGPPSRRYGFAPWVLTFVLGVAFLAAAASKVREGTTWIRNGTVKYHFVSDLDEALVTWGPTLTSNHTIAVGLSLAAVLMEVMVISAVFATSGPYRAACGLMSLALLSAFWLFQGIMWPGWWILLVGFLPWSWIGGRVDTGAPVRPLTIAQCAFVMAVVVQQVYASWTRLEARPFVSAYDMYSTTYASPAVYEASSNLRYRVVAVTGRGVVELPTCALDEPAARLFEKAAAGGRPEQERVRGLITPCLAEVPDVTMVGLEGDREVYDWKSGRFEWKRRLDRIGPVRADWLRE